MKLQGIAAAHPAMARPLAAQVPADEPSAQAAGQIAQRDALRESLPSRQAGNGAGLAAGRTGTSVLRSIANTSQGSSAHASPRTQTVVRQSDGMQIQDDSTEDSFALPDELGGAITDWVSAAADNASDEPDGDAEVRQRPSHLRVSRDGSRQQQRGQQQQPQQQPQKQSKQEPPTRATERRDGKPTAQTRTDGLADQTQPSGQPPLAGFASESPWAVPPGARSTARIAPIAGAVPAQRHVAEPDSRLGAHESSSDTVAALMWALAAMVVAIIATLLLTVFSAHETDTDTGIADPGHHEAPRRDERRTR